MWEYTYMKYQAILLCLMILPSISLPGMQELQKTEGYE